MAIHEDVARRLHVEVKQVVDARVVGDEVVTLVDYGIGGTKKHRLPYDWLYPAPGPAADGDDTEPDNTAAPSAGVPVEEVAEMAGVGHLADKLHEAGFEWSDHILQADEDELTAISGIGRATARRLKEAAAELEALAND
jgi:hypothetical protein